MRKLWAVTVTCLIAATLLACGEDDEGGEEADNVVAPDAPSGAETLTVGVIGPLSGSSASFGVALDQGATLFAEELAEAGGFEVDGTTYSLEVVTYDHGAEAGEAATVTERLAVQDEVDYIVGNAVGATCEAAQAITEVEQIFFSFVCFGRTNLGEDKPLSYRVLPGPDEVAPILYGWIDENLPEVEDIAVIAPADQSGVDTTAAIVAAAESFDIGVTSEESYERGTQEFSSLLTRIIGDDPDMIDLSGSAAGDGALILRQLNELGYEGEVAWTALLDPAPVADTAGEEAVEGLLSLLAWDLSGDVSAPEMQDFATRYEERFDEPASLIAAAQYATFEIITRTMEETGSLDPTVVAEEIAEIGTFEGTAVGPVDIQGEETYGIERQFVFPLVVSEISEGEPSALELVEP